MKKILISSLIVVVIAVAAIQIVAYSGESIKVGDQEGVYRTGEETVEKKSETTTLLGQVEKVVGNELSLKLSDDEAVMPEDEEESSEPKAFSLDEGAMQKLKNGQMVTMGDGTVITSDKDGDAPATDKSNGENNKGEVKKDKANFDSYTQLKFNGEYKDVTISAGIEIVNKINGKEGKTSDIKEGSIVTVTMDNNTNSVTKVTIMR